MFPRRNPAGLTLVELMLAIAVLAMIMVVLTTMAHGVQCSTEYCNGYGLSTQHARVALDQISTAVINAYASENYPGVWAFADTAGSWTFPDTLVIWRPSGTPSNALGPPLMKELQVFCSDPADSSKLVSITNPTDATAWSAYTNPTAMQTQITAMKSAASIQKTLLTDLMRHVLLTGMPAGVASDRACLRFEVQLSPTAADFSAYRAGSKIWTAVNWPQGIYGSKFGLRQVWLRTELQLLPGKVWAANNASTNTAVPYVGSATFNTELPQ